MTKNNKRLLIWIGCIVTMVVCIILLPHSTRENDIDNNLQEHGSFDIMAQSVFLTIKTLSQAKDISYEYIKDGYWRIKI